MPYVDYNLLTPEQQQEVKTYLLTKPADFYVEETIEEAPKEDTSTVEARFKALAEELE